MPFKSKAQRAKIYILEAQGKLPKGTAEEWEKATKQAGTENKLPERIHVKKIKVKEI